MIKYEVNEKERTVKASIQGCNFDVIEMILRRTGKKNFKICNIKDGSLDEMLEAVEELKRYGNFKDSTISNVVSVTVKCDERDVFSETEGKKIAAKRLQAKYKKALNRAIRNWRTDTMLDMLKVTKPEASRFEADALVAELFYWGVE